MDHRTELTGAGSEATAETGLAAVIHRRSRFPGLDPQSAHHRLFRWVKAI